MSNSSEDKRKFKRYDVADFIVVIFANNKLGHLINISENGLAVHLFNEELESLPENCNTSLLTVGKGFLVENFPLTLIRKELVHSSSINIVAAEFKSSDPAKLDKIKQYISGLS